MKEELPLVLSLFPGIDLLGRAFEEEGFCVVRGPDVIFGGDIRGWHVPTGRFDGVIGGPPCQCFSRLAHMVRQNGLKPRFGNLIPEFERVAAEGAPSWWLMENVPDAPLPAVPGYAGWSCLLNNRQLGEAQNRVRRWSFGVRGPQPKVLMIDTVALEPVAFERAALGGTDRREIPVKPGGSGKPKTTLPFNAKSQKGFSSICHKQGLPEELDLPGWTVEGKCKAVGNAVPMAMGRALAKAVKEATS